MYGHPIDIHKLAATSSPKALSEVPTGILPCTVLRVYCVKGQVAVFGPVLIKLIRVFSNVVASVVFDVRQNKQAAQFRI